MLDAIMNTNKWLGQGLTGGTKLLLQLWGLSGAILHFYTVGGAFFLADGGLLGVIAGFAALCLPVVSWLVVFGSSWMETGSFINNYSLWFLAWLAFSALLLALTPLGARFAKK
jgi:hypothetical protein